MKYFFYHNMYEKNTIYSKEKKSLLLQLVTQNDLMYSRMCSDRLPATF